MAVHRGAIGSSSMDGAGPCASVLFTATRRRYGTADVEVLTFSSFGVENLLEMIATECGCKP
jgi:hypothetical protein